MSWLGRGYFELIKEFVVVFVGFLRGKCESERLGFRERYELDKSLQGTYWTRNELQPSPERELQAIHIYQSTPYHLTPYKKKANETHAY